MPLLASYVPLFDVGGQQTPSAAGGGGGGQESTFRPFVFPAIDEKCGESCSQVAYLHAYAGRRAFHASTHCLPACGGGGARAAPTHARPQTGTG